MGSPIRLEALEPAQVCDIDLFDETASLRDDPGFMRVMFEVVRSRGLYTCR